VADGALDLLDSAMNAFLNAKGAKDARAQAKNKRLHF
jgi:hypothetical protein